VESLNEIGTQLDQARAAYTKSLNQLSTGSGNLVSQAVKLGNLGIKNKKQLNKDISNKAVENELLQ
jgi:DNA recombination protein RmuC